MGIKSIRDINLETVNRFLIHAAPRHTGSMDTVLLALKYLSGHLSDCYGCQDFRPALQSRPACRKKLMPVFSKTDVEAIISEARASSPAPLRDAAAFMLASRLGMRAVDVAGLKLTDISWGRWTVRFTQSKTGVEIELPFDAEVGNAVAEYILNERPHTDSPFVFIRARRPFAGMTAAALGDRLRTHMRHSEKVERKSGDMKGFHSFRRYVATEMVNNGVPAETVKDVLGHTSIDSMKPYIRISMEKLALCALDISGIPVTQEEYADEL